MGLLDEILDKKMNEYHSKFGDYFPTEELCLTRKETIDAIDECIKINQTAEEKFNLSHNDSLIY